MTTVTLSDGIEVFCLQPSEALVLDSHVKGYLAHGVQIRDGDTILDIGANIGLFSVRAVQRCPATRIFAFEPIPDIFRVLQRNAARHGGGRLVALPLGIADRPGRTSFMYYPNCPALSTAHPELWTNDEASLTAAVKGNVRAARKVVWYARLVPAALSGLIKWNLRRGAVKVECELRTVSQVIDQYDLRRVDLLKIDCEGAELAVLHGIDDAHWGRIGQVVAEVHDAEGRLGIIRSLLERQGFTHVVTKEEGFEDTPIVNVHATRTPA